MKMTSLQTRRLTYAALYLAIALVLPFITGQIPEIGAMLCPMHIVLFPAAVAMAFELAVYGGMAGFLHQKLPRKKGVAYAVLLISMIAGRIVWGAVRVILAGLSGSTFTWAIFLAGAVTNAIPGIILQLVLIPILVIAMERAGLSLNGKAENV